jgi:hypothetical protein
MSTVHCLGFKHFLSGTAFEDASRISHGYDARGNRSRHNGAGTNRGPRANVRHHDCRSANPTILADHNWFEVLLVRSRNSSIRPSAVLVSAAQDLDVACNLRSVAKAAAAKDAIRPDVHAAPDRRRTLRKE